MTRGNELVRVAHVSLGRLCLCACLLLVNPGCYSYSTVDVNSVTPGETVRARVSADGQRELPLMQNGSAGVLVGRLVENGRDGLLLVVPSMTRQVGFRFETMNQRLLIPREYVVTLDQRRLDKAKTTVLLGVAGTATTVLMVELLSGTSGSSGSPNDSDGGISASSVLLRGWSWVP